MKLSARSSSTIIDCFTAEEVEEWLRTIAIEVGDLKWKPVGGKENNIHTIEVSTNSGLALVERPTNCIDAMLDLQHHLRREECSSPSAAAEAWYGVKNGDISAIDKAASHKLSGHIAVRVYDSNDENRPTVQIQDEERDSTPTTGDQHYCP